MARNARWRAESSNEFGGVVAQSQLAANGEPGNGYEIGGYSVVTERSKKQAVHPRGEARSNGEEGSVTERQTRPCLSGRGG